MQRRLRPPKTYSTYRVGLPEGQAADGVREVQRFVCEGRHVVDVHAALLVGVASSKVEVAGHLVHLHSATQGTWLAWQRKLAVRHLQLQLVARPLL